MTMPGSFCSMNTRYPTLEEIESCTHIILSDKYHWDPTVLVVNISDVIRNLPSRYQNMSSYHEFDCLMSSCGLSTNELIQRSTASVRISLHEAAKDRRLKDAAKVYHKPDPFPMELNNDSRFTLERHHKVTAESLARKFHIGIKRASHTLKATTQEAIRSALHPLTRRYRTDFMQSKYRRLNTTFFTNTLFPNSKSLNQNSCAQIWANADGYVYVDPLRSKKDTHISLNHFVEDVGVPRQIFSDGAKEETGPTSKFVKRARDLSCKLRSSEPYSQWQNRVEGTIGKLKAR